MAGFYKIAVNIPEGYLEELMDSVTGTIRPMYPGYDRTFNYWPVTGTWRPLPGSHPYDGSVGEVTVAEEMRVEFAVSEGDLEAAVAAILAVHPYEEPAIDVLPRVGWRDVIPSDGT